MIITFQLGGQERKIRWDGVQFTAYAPNDALLGHYTVFGNAVLAHVKEVARVDGDLGINQERLSIQEFVKRFESIVKDVRSLTEDDVPSLTKVETPKKGPKGKRVSFQHDEAGKIKAVEDENGRWVMGVDPVRTSHEDDIDDL